MSLVSRSSPFGVDNDLHSAVYAGWEMWYVNAASPSLRIIFDGQLFSVTNYDNPASLACMSDQIAIFSVPHPMLQMSAGPFPSRRAQPRLPPSSPNIFLDIGTVSQESFLVGNSL